MVIRSTKLRVWLFCFSIFFFAYGSLVVRIPMTVVKSSVFTIKSSVQFPMPRRRSLTSAWQFERGWIIGMRVNSSFCQVPGDSTNIVHGISRGLFEEGKHVVKALVPFDKPIHSTRGLPTSADVLSWKYLYVYGFKQWRNVTTRPISAVTVRHRTQ